MSEEMKNTMNEVNAEELEKAAGGAARSYRYGVTVKDLVAWNKIANPNLIVVGQVLKIYF